MLLNKTRLGVRCYNISQQLGIPTATVEEVVKGYIRSLNDSVEHGEDITVEGLFSIHVMNRETEPYIRGAVSASLKNRIKDNGIKVRSENDVVQDA